MILGIHIIKYCFVGTLKAVHIISSDEPFYNEKSKPIQKNIVCKGYQIAGRNIISVKILQGENSCETKKNDKRLVAGNHTSWTEEMIGSCKDFKINVNPFKLNFKLEIQGHVLDLCPIKVTFQMNNTYFRGEWLLNWKNSHSHSKAFEAERTQGILIAKMKKRLNKYKQNGHVINIFFLQILRIFSKLFYPE